MGVVYKARESNLNRIVALKAIRTGSRASAEEQSRFVSEARAIASLHHDNIVQIYDFDRRQDGLLYYAMEFMEGGSLAAKLRGTAHAARRVCPARTGPCPRPRPRSSE